MEALFLREIGDISFYRVHSSDIRGLEIIKNKFNEIHLGGEVIFTGDDFDYLLVKKRAEVLELELLYGDSNTIIGYITLAGDWDYATKTAKLNVNLSGLYQSFERLLDNEKKYPSSNVEFNYDSYIYNVWGIGAYQVFYDDFVTCSANPNPPDWVDGKIYNGLTDYGSGAKAGDSDVAAYHNSKKWLSISPGNDSEPAIANPRWLETPSMTTIGQERAPYQFSETAKLDDDLQRWYGGGCTADTYTNTTRGFGLSGVIMDILLTTGFSLATDWLHYPSSFNPKYPDLYITNTEAAEAITLTEAIAYIEMFFNVEYRLSGTELLFRHGSELIQPYKGVYPDSHNFENRIDIRLFKKDAKDEVFEHRLKFSKSPLETHIDSVIEYNNTFVDSNTIEGNFDVDFQFTTNTGGKNCPVLLLPNNKIDVDNTAFVPSLLHENFYFFGREFKTGLFNDVETLFILSYKEQTNFEAGPELNLNELDYQYNCLLKYGLGRFESVSFNIQSNKYKISASIQYPY